MQFNNLLAAVFKPNLEADIKSQIAWTVLRVAVGVFMVHNGLDKLSDIEGFSAAYVEFIGLPFPIFFSYVAAFTELIGAPLVAIGLLTRPAALGLFSTMLVAMYHHILVAGLSIPYLELSAVYASCFFFFAINGGGVISLDAVIANFLTGDEVNEEKLESLEENYKAKAVAK